MKKFTLFPVDGEPSEFEVVGSYAIVIMFIIALVISVGPWVVFLFNFTTF
jgi:hypothetical protein